jgi:hydroxymethylpyrimidine pyrophosphatase-like HAD family hydrolase
MALGDTTVDVPMLRFAGIGVAVPDGHPSALAAADWVATPAEAVARALRLGG